MGRKRKLSDEGPVDASTWESGKLSGSGAYRTKECDQGIIIPTNERGSDLTGEEFIGAVEHPLLNDVILTNLFKFIPAAGLLTARQVCRSWLDASLSGWRSSATMILIELTDTSYFCGDCFTPLSEFLQHWERDCQTQPYQRFLLEAVKFRKIPEGIGEKRESRSGGTRGAEQQVVPKFWRVVGPHIRKLTLLDCEANTPEDFFWRINNYCQNLETLVIRDSKFCKSRTVWNKRSREELLYKEPIHDVHPNLKSLYLHTSKEQVRLACVMRMNYLELMTNFPNLTFIKPDTYFGQTHIRDMLEAVKIVRRQEPRRFPDLKLEAADPIGFELAIGGIHEHFQQVMELYRELHTPLHSICLSDDLPAREIEDILKFGGTSLTTILALIRSPRHRFGIPLGVELTNLRHLTMLESFCITLEIFQYTPNLEQMYIYDSDGSQVPDRRRGKTTTLDLARSKDEMDNVRLLRLTTLHLDNRLRDSEDLGCLIKWIPNVTELKMCLDDKQIQITCQIWRDLRRLEIIGGGVTDRGLTGIKLRTISKREEDALNDEQTMPSIANLQNLQTFVGLATKLSNASVYHGFLKMRRLQRICFRNAWQLREKAKKALQQRNIQCESEHSSEFDDWGGSEACRKMHDRVEQYYYNNRD